MHPAYQVHSPLSPPSPSSRPNKVILQRQYREKEGECFTVLRDVIKELSGEELQKRQEILRKAVDLLSTVSEIRRQGEAQVAPGPPAPYHDETPSSADPTDMTVGQVHSGYFAQSSIWPQTRQTSAEFDAQSESAHYYTTFGQQYSPMPNMDMDSAIVSANYHWPNHHQH